MMTAMMTAQLSLNLKLKLDEAIVLSLRDAGTSCARRAYPIRCSAERWVAATYLAAPGCVGRIGEL